MSDPIRWGAFALHRVGNDLELHDDTGRPWRVRVCSEVTPLIANWYSAIVHESHFAELERRTCNLPGSLASPSWRRRQSRLSDQWVRASRRLLAANPYHRNRDDMLRLIGEEERAPGGLDSLERCLTGPVREGNKFQRRMSAYLLAFDEFCIACDALEGVNRSRESVLDFLLTHVPTHLSWRVLEWDLGNVQKRTRRVARQANVPALIEAALYAVAGGRERLSPFRPFEDDVWPSRNTCRAGDPLGLESKERVMQWIASVWEEL
jgi:hypothetical protein